MTIIWTVVALGLGYLIYTISWWRGYNAAKIEVLEDIFEGDDKS